MKFRKEKYGKRTIYRNDWMEFCTGWHKPAFKISPASYFDNRLMIQIAPFWGQLFLHIDRIRSKYDECDPPQYGFYFYGEGSFWPDTFVWCWNRKTHHFYLPWALEWQRTSKKLKTGEWLHERKGDRRKGIGVDWYKKETEDQLWQETYPYTYKLNSGEVQHRMAKVTVEQREWRPRWFQWTPLFSKTRTSIDIEFDGEVGERSGSWKGGTIGCGWDLKPGQTPEQALREMEATRKM